MSTGDKIGLRELKKERTRRLIRHHALRLIERNGYANTTVEQIAEACEIAPSTFFRYFKNKAEAVTVDFVDATMLDHLRAEPIRPGESLVPVLRRVLRRMYEAMTDDEWAEERQRLRVLQSVPELHTALAEEAARPVRYGIAVVAERAGLPTDNPLVRAYAGAVVGAMSSLSLRDDDPEQRFELPPTREGLIEAFEQLCDVVDRIVVMPPELRALLPQD